MSRSIFTAEPAANLYDSQHAIHGDARVADRRGRKDEAAFLVGIATTARRWADAEAA